ncbi:MAG: hypothetical protein U1F42_06180 [Candidatus Competibacteraceae bacterium]
MKMAMRRERSLLSAVADTVQGRIWIMDRNFCVLGWLFGDFTSNRLFFVVRQHGNVTYKPLKPLELISKSTAHLISTNSQLVTRAFGGKNPGTPGYLSN